MKLTVGRQDIFLGDGWLVGDGTPEDGSFTYFWMPPGRPTNSRTVTRPSTPSASSRTPGPTPGCPPSAPPPSQDGGTGAIAVDRLKRKGRDSLDRQQEPAGGQRGHLLYLQTRLGHQRLPEPRYSPTTRTSSHSAAAFRVWWRTTGAIRRRGLISSGRKQYQYNPPLTASSVRTTDFTTSAPSE